MFIYRVLSAYTSFISFFALIFCAYTLYQRIKYFIQEKKRSSFSYFYDLAESIHSFTPCATIILTISLLGALITSPTVHEAVGIHNLKLKDEGEYNFYVEAYGDLYPARVRVEKETHDEGDNTRTETKYYIKNLFLPDGKTVQFLEIDPVEINKSADLYTEEEDIWCCTLINEHAYLPDYPETSELNPLMISIYVLLYFLPNTLSIIAVLLHKEK